MFKSPSRKNEIDNILLQKKLRQTEQVSYIVIATYASFTRPKIFAELNQLSAKILLIADECHGVGNNAETFAESKLQTPDRIVSNP
jgi:superfamily II DNA or RNA helicase